MAASSCAEICGGRVAEGGSDLGALVGDSGGSDLGALVGDSGGLTGPTAAGDEMLLGDVNVNRGCEHVLALWEKRELNVVSQYRLPPINCPEKIVFVVDCSPEMGVGRLSYADSSTASVLDVVKRMLKMFVRLKSAINSDHEFAIVELSGAPRWRGDFSGAQATLSNINKLTSTLLPVDSCDISLLFKLLHDKVEIPQGSSENHERPPYVVRTILIYGRSTDIPQATEIPPPWVSSPFFTLDVLFIHESFDPSPDEHLQAQLVTVEDTQQRLPHNSTNIHKIQAVFDFFLALDSQGRYYIFNCGPVSIHILNQGAKLLAHPLQRPPQHLAKYSLRLPSQETATATTSSSREPSTESSSTLSMNEGTLVELVNVNDIPQQKPIENHSPLFSS